MHDVRLIWRPTWLAGLSIRSHLGPQRHCTRLELRSRDDLHGSLWFRLLFCQVAEQECRIRHRADRASTQAYLHSLAQWQLYALSR